MRLLLSVSRWVVVYLTSLEQSPIQYFIAQDCITKVDVLEYAELGMEAVWKIDVVDFPLSLKRGLYGASFPTQGGTNLTLKLTTAHANVETSDSEK